jgi:predicted HAD superfamily Cof-like phosphohydrolase
MRFLYEELNEMDIAVTERNPEEVVDALIDLCVVAIGTLDSFGVDAYKAWDSVHNANMAKEPGVKETRPNPLGLPDLIKPDGWTGPDHSENHGYITDAV